MATGWRGEVAGVPAAKPPAALQVARTPEPEPSLDEWFIELAARLHVFLHAPTTDAQQAFNLVGGGLLAPADGGGFLLTPGDVRTVLRYYGGEGAFLQDLLTVLPPAMQHIIRHVRRRLNDDQPLPDDLADAQRMQQKVEAQRPLTEGFIALKRAPEKAVALIDEVLGTAKKYYAGVANELAESGHPVLATLVQTASDVFIPGNTAEVVIGFLPIGRFGGLLKVGFRRMAATRPALRKAAARLEAILNKELNPMIRRLADDAADGDMRAVKEVLEVEERVNNAVPKEVADEILPGRGSPEFAEALERELAEEVRRNPVRLRPPDGSRAKVEFITDTAPNGRRRYIQKISSSLEKRPGGRISNAKQTAEAAGLQHVEGQHWTHLVPDVVSGDDAVYNLVRADPRVNQSYLALIDRVEKLGDLKDMRMEIRVFFDSPQDLLNRHAVGIEWNIIIPDRPIEQLRAWDLLTKPSLTYKQLIAAVFKSMRDPTKAGAYAPDAERLRKLLDALGIPHPG